MKERWRTIGLDVYDPEYDDKIASISRRALEIDTFAAPRNRKSDEDELTNQFEALAVSKDERHLREHRELAGGLYRQRDSEGPSRPQKFPRPSCSDSENKYVGTSNRTACSLRQRTSGHGDAASQVQTRLGDT